MRELTIGTRRIADDAQAYVIAEVGGNHGGSDVVARQMIRMAAACGASAVKFQKRDLASLYSPALLALPYEHEHSYGKTYGEHREALELNARQYLACKAQADVCHVDFFATAFDEPSADFLMEVGVPAIKIHSGGHTDEPLLRHVASLGVPILVSTGGGSASDTDRAVQIIAAQTSAFAILHCTASYRVTANELNLLVIPALRLRYPDTVIGFSTHAPTTKYTPLAASLGASIIEHHFTLSRAGKGTDQAFSLEPKGLQTLVEDLRDTKDALGDGVKRFYPSEMEAIAKMRRWWISNRWQIGTIAEQTPRVSA